MNIICTRSCAPFVTLRANSSLGLTNQLSDIKSSPALVVNSSSSETSERTHFIMTGKYTPPICMYKLVSKELLQQVIALIW